MWYVCVHSQQMLSEQMNENRGSAMDVSKLVSVLLKHGGNVKDYLGIDNIPGRGLPTIMVPTTAGTGSEVSKYGIFDDREAKTKLGVVSLHLVADLALIDPEVTSTMPPAITASTGCDAFVYKVEAAELYQLTSVVLTTSAFLATAIVVVGI